jgi:hypothetical protein
MLSWWRKTSHSLQQRVRSSISIGLEEEHPQVVHDASPPAIISPTMPNVMMITGQKRKTTEHEEDQEDKEKCEGQEAVAAAPSRKTKFDPSPQLQKMTNNNIDDNKDNMQADEESTTKAHSSDSEWEDDEQVFESEKETVIYQDGSKRRKVVPTSTTVTGPKDQAVTPTKDVQLHHPTMEERKAVLALCKSDEWSLCLETLKRNPTLGTCSIGIPVS